MNRQIAKHKRGGGSDIRVTVSMLTGLFDMT